MPIVIASLSAGVERLSSRCGTHWKIVCLLGIACVPLPVQAQLEGKISDFVKGDPSEVLDQAAKEPESVRVLNTLNEQGTETKAPTFYWPVGSEIKIGFIDGTQEDRDFVKGVGSEWFEFVNLSVHYVDVPSTADVRISIKTTPERSYSYIGTSARIASIGEPTMQLALLPNLSEEERRKIVLHEFGHMLGLIPENQNPNSKMYVDLDWDKVYQHFAQLGWNREMVDQYYRSSEKISYLYNGKPFDPHSVMIHPLPKELVAEDKAILSRIPPVLSSGDKQFIAQIYPKESPTLLAFREVVGSLDQNQPEVAKALQSSFKKVKDAEANIQNVALADSLTPTGMQAPSSSENHIEQLVIHAGNTQKEIIKIYSELPASKRETAAPQLGKLYVQARAAEDRASIQKSIYGQNDQYSPDTYRQIFERSQSVCYLNNLNKRVGTCFMIGTNLVLTCNHTLAIPHAEDDYYEPEDLRVSFGQGSDPESEEIYEVDEIVFQGIAGGVDGIKVDAMDFALLKVGQGKVSGKPPSENGVQPLKIHRDTRTPKNTAVYVIGYPGLTGQKTVADNARIFLGFNVTPNTRLGYELEVYEELERLREKAYEETKDKAEALQAVAREKAELEGRQLLDRFKLSFKSGESTPPRWYLISSLIGDPPHPAFALDSDTYHGNSGSPVFERVSSEVVGVLFRGSPDKASNFEVGYLRHEEAIPLYVLLDNWREHQPDALTKYGIEFED